MSVGKLLVGYGVRLRPVEANDADFIVHERRTARARPFLGATSPALSAQRAWIAGQRDRADDYYYLCESSAGERLGTIGLYNFAGPRAEWGRFLIKAGVKAAPAALLLLLVFAFEELGLTDLRCVTVATNARAIRFYERAGFVAVAEHRGVVEVDGESKKTVMHVLRSGCWPPAKKGLLAAAHHCAGGLS